MATYKVIRFFHHHSNEVIKTGLSLDEAQEHCQDPETSFSTCTTKEAKRRTKEFGLWFDGYEEE
jgi:hypothetical protein